MASAIQAGARSGTRAIRGASVLGIVRTDDTAGREVPEWWRVSVRRVALGATGGTEDTIRTENEEDHSMPPDKIPA
jgi:hypothetical protein